jgi:ABC-type branched-subunit amino acid transport system ATPase component
MIMMTDPQFLLLDIAKSLLCNPTLLLVDEPSVGLLSPLIAKNIYKELLTLKAEGRTILLVDQDVRSAIAVADVVVVLELGRVKTHGTGENFEGQLSEADLCRKVAQKQDVTAACWNIPLRPASDQHCFVKKGCL